MGRVTIELWLWQSGELKGDFESLSETRSIRQESVDEGTNVRDFLFSLAQRYRPIEERVFDVHKKELYAEVVGTYNERFLRAEDFYAQILGEGDKIIIMQMYSGG